MDERAKSKVVSETISNASERGRNVVEIATMVALTGAENIADAVLIATCCQTGVQALAAVFVANTTDKSYSFEHTLFVGILAAHCSPARSNDGNSMFAFDPEIIARSIECWEKATGKRAEDYLCLPMVQAARDTAADKAAMEWHAKRRSAEVNGLAMGISAARH